MGPVVTINSATLMNKGLEIIEAHYLFAVPYSKIEAVIHPQSVVHSLVEFVDGSTLAQASPPNMKGPISFALGYPDRVPGAMSPVDWTTSHSWEFSPIDLKRFPAVGLALHCGEKGKGLPAIFNAANEVAVQAFVEGNISFTDIVKTVSAVIEKLDTASLSAPRDIDDVSAIENDARSVASSEVARAR
jgi:1-deoxy-D-xylulose-5-phosphate reductoisomerase